MLGGLWGGQGKGKGKKGPVTLRCYMHRYYERPMGWPGQGHGVPPPPPVKPPL